MAPVAKCPVFFCVSSSVWIPWSPAVSCHLMLPLALIGNTVSTKAGLSSFQDSPLLRIIDSVWGSPQGDAQRPWKESPVPEAGRTSALFTHSSLCKSEEGCVCVCVFVCVCKHACSGAIMFPARKHLQNLCYANLFPPSQLTHSIMCKPDVTV